MLSFKFIIMESKQEV